MITKWDDYSTKMKVGILFYYLHYALDEKLKGKCRKIDMYSLACQFGGMMTPRVKKEHFELIKKMTIEEIVAIIESKE